MNLKSILLGSLLLAIAVGALAWTARADTGTIDIQQACFVGARPHDGDMNLTAELFITNGDAGRSGAVTITVFVVPQRSGLSSYTTSLEVGAIGGRTTEQVGVPLTIPRFNASESYRVDFLVFEDKLLTQRGSGMVGWGGGWQGGTDMLMRADLAGEAMSVSAPTFEKLR